MRIRSATIPTEHEKTAAVGPNSLLKALLINSVFHSFATFLPHNRKVFDRFEELADKAVVAAQLLAYLTAEEQTPNSFALNPDDRSMHLMQVRDRLKAVESEGDSIVHEVLQGLFYDHTRVTEEKGDIRYFLHNLDDVIDGVEKAVARLAFTLQRSIPEPVVEFAPIILETAQEISRAVACLRDIRRNETTIETCCIRINELENKADRVNRRWLKELMTTPVEDPNEILARLLIKEIVDILEDTMDNCEDVANILETFRLKGGI